MIWTKLLNILENRKSQVRREKLEVQQKLDQLMDAYNKKTDEIDQQQRKIREEEELFWQTLTERSITGSMVKASKQKTQYMGDKKLNLENELARILEETIGANKEFEALLARIRKISQKQEKYKFLHRRQQIEADAMQLKLEEAEMEESTSTRLRGTK